MVVRRSKDYSCPLCRVRCTDGDVAVMSVRRDGRRSAELEDE